MKQILSSGQVYSLCFMLTCKEIFLPNSVPPPFFLALVSPFWSLHPLPYFEQNGNHEIYFYNKQQQQQQKQVNITFILNETKQGKQNEATSW